VSKPATDDRHVNAGRDKTYSYSVPESVWTDSLAEQRRGLCGRSCCILLQFESDAGCLEGVSVPVCEDGFIFSTRVPFQKTSSSSTVSGHNGQIRSFRLLKGDCQRTAWGVRSNAS
jgi:hypothetical protein